MKSTTGTIIASTTVLSASAFADSAMAACHSIRACLIAMTDSNAFYVKLDEAAAFMTGAKEPPSEPIAA